MFNMFIMHFCFVIGNKILHIFSKFVHVYWLFKTLSLSSKWNSLYESCSCGLFICSFQFRTNIYIWAETTTAVRQNISLETPYKQVTIWSDCSLLSLLVCMYQSWIGHCIQTSHKNSFIQNISLGRERESLEKMHFITFDSLENSFQYSPAKLKEVNSNQTMPVGVIEFWKAFSIHSRTMWHKWVFWFLMFCEHLNSNI